MKIQGKIEPLIVFIVYSEDPNDKRFSVGTTKYRKTLQSIEDNINSFHGGNDEFAGWTRKTHLKGFSLRVRPVEVVRNFIPRVMSRSKIREKRAKIEISAGFRLVSGARRLK